MKYWFYILVFLFTSSPCCYAQIDMVENKGQWHPSVQFKTDINNGAFFIENNGFTVLLHEPSDFNKLAAFMHGNRKNIQQNDPLIVRSHAYKVKLLGAQIVKPEGEKPSEGRSNYFLGNDPTKWAGDCRNFQAVQFKGVYPNIDVRYYSDGSRLKYDFIIHPGGNPNQIAMQFDGADELKVTNRELHIKTSVGEVKELSPYSYTSSLKGREEVSCKYVLKNNIVTFQVKDYDLSSTLVIDPTIIFSSFTGSAATNWGYTGTPGPDGSFYAGGVVFENGFPVSTGAFQTAYQGGLDEGVIGGYDIAIFKFSSNGSRRVYATYLGGSRNEQPHSLIVDAQGQLIIAGRTSSGNYPATTTLGSRGGFDIFVTKLNAAGSSIIGSFIAGGSADDGVNIRPKYVGTLGAESLRRNYGDDARSEVIIDNNNNILVASCTQSANFPVTSGVFQSAIGGGQDGVIMKFNSNLSQVLFSTFFGGEANDACYVVDINPLNNAIYVGGATASSSLPGDKSGTIQSAFQGNLADGFVTHISNDGSSITKTSYIGTSGIDAVYGLKFDRAGFPYVMGTTTGTWPVINATFSNAGGKQFIAKLRPDLSAYVYSTVFGTNIPQPNISPIAFLVDRCENVYVSGWGGGGNVEQGYSTGTTSGLPQVNPLSGMPTPDGADFYFFVLQRNATAQLFGSHFGQFGGFGDHVDGGTSRFDENGVIYQALCTACGQASPFPTTPGVWAPVSGSDRCNEAAVKIFMNFAGVGSGIRSAIEGVINKKYGCVPLLVDFRDTLNQGKKFYWNFGDGSPLLVTTLPNTQHIFNAVGVYTVMLISEDSSTCNVRDTSFITITVKDNKANLNFTSAKLPPCESLTMQFTNISSAAGNNFSNQSFIWDFGDGSPRITAGLSPPQIHTYPSPGNYKVRLILLDTTFCNAPDSIEKEIRINPLVEARFSTPPSGCVPYTALFDNTSLAGTDFIWEFGDGTTSTEVYPTHLYATVGTFNVRLIAKDTTTCNKIDTSAYFTITVYPKPTAAAFASAPVPNTPIRFTNQSIGAIRYIWDFGDGETSTAVNPTHLFNVQANFNVRLIAFNEGNCSDTFFLPVSPLVNALLDVPNAFTPARFGTNNTVSVRGFGIGKMDWKIYNRWGQLVFSTQNYKQGWDGTFKGKLQPMDVYVYTLDVEFTDGKKLRKTGDITLLR